MDSRPAADAMHPDILSLHARIERDHWWFVARRRILGALLADVSSPDSGAILLDLGCGTGGNLSAWKQIYRCIGVEVDADAVDFAKRTHPGCRFVKASVYESAGWGLSSSVDVCLMLDVLEHLDEPEVALANAIAYLRPGGHLIVTVPADPRLWSRHDRRHGHRRRFAKQSLTALFDEQPLEPRLVSHFNARLYPLIRLWRRAQNLFGVGEGSSSTGDLSMPPRPINWLLTRIFSGEQTRLRAALTGRRAPYRVGVSLIAIYRRAGDS